MYPPLHSLTILWGHGGKAPIYKKLTPLLTRRRRGTTLLHSQTRKALLPVVQINYHKYQAKPQP